MLTDAYLVYQKQDKSHFVTREENHPKIQRMVRNSCLQASSNVPQSGPRHTQYQNQTFKSNPTVFSNTCPILPPGIIFWHSSSYKILYHPVAIVTQPFLIHASQVLRKASYCFTLSHFIPHFSQWKIHFNTTLPTVDHEFSHTFSWLLPNLLHLQIERWSSGSLMNMLNMCPWISNEYADSKGLI